MTQFINPTLSTSTTSSRVIVAEAKPVAWQQFGCNFSHPLSIQEAIQEAGANFNVDKQPLIRVPQSVVDAIRNGQPVENLVLSTSDIIENMVATRRDDTDTTLGVVGKNYGVVQNTRAFDFINFIKEVSGEEPLIETAGVLGQGERIFVTARLGADSYIDPNDAIKNYVVFTNTHDGSGSVMAFFTPVRVICQNTLNMAIKGAANKVVFKHTSRVNERIDQVFYEKEARENALRVFSQSVNFSKKFTDAMMNLKNQKVTEDYINEFVGNIFLSDAVMKEFKAADFRIEETSASSRAKNLMAALRNAIESGIGQDLYRGSKLWLLNGITTYLHSDTKHSDAENEYRSLMDGDGAKKVQLAYNFLTA